MIVIMILLFADKLYHQNIYVLNACCRDAWDMAAELCLSQLPSLVEDPNVEFQVI
jgi:hypothetical protein